jgi:hypothetical protein
MTAAAASTSRLLLAYYPTDETLSERLEGVMGEWDGLRRRGIGKSLYRTNIRTRQEAHAR